MRCVSVTSLLLTDVVTVVNRGIGRLSGRTKRCAPLNVRTVNPVVESISTEPISIMSVSIPAFLTSLFTSLHLKFVQAECSSNKLQFAYILLLNLGLRPRFGFQVQYRISGWVRVKFTFHFRSPIRSQVFANNKSLFRLVLV